MIEIDYRLSLDWAMKPGEVNLAEADEMTLRYSVFLGDLIFKVDGVDFSTHWRWVPMLDFAICLLSVLEDLSAGKEQSSIEFTESEAELVFRRIDDLVFITSNYNSNQASASYRELEDVSVAFSIKVFSDFQRLNPEASQNAAIRMLQERYPVLQRLNPGINITPNGL
jgi:hypothetical protein